MWPIPANIYIVFFFFWWFTYICSGSVYLVLFLLFWHGSVFVMYTCSRSVFIDLFLFFLRLYNSVLVIGIVLF